MTGSLSMVTLALFLLFLPFIHSKTRFFQFTVGRVVVNLDGVPRDSIGINGQIPGPTIIVRAGDRLNINVTNTLDEPTSIHWHGLLQINSLTSDGAVGVSNCPIPPGGSYLYNFSAVRPGSFWYHSHQSVQYVDGLKGAFVVLPGGDLERGSILRASEEEEEEEEEEEDEEDSLTLQLSDWYHISAEKLLTSYLTPDSNGNEPVPDSVVINGKGQYKCNVTMRNCQYDIYRVKTGRAVKVRVINTSAFAMIWFSIDNHTLVVVEVDGVPVVPMALDKLRLNAGQRYALLIDVPSLPFSAKYWIRASLERGVFAKSPTTNLAMALLVYETEEGGGGREGGASLIPSVDLTQYGLTHENFRHTDRVLSSVPQPAGNSVSWISFIPNPPIPPPPANRAINFIITFSNNKDQINLAHVNNVSFVPLEQTTVLNYVRAGLPLPKTVNALELKQGEVVDILINNMDNGEHPIHLHGHDFWVLGMGDPGTGNFNATKHALNVVNPIVRDTITVNSMSYTVIRLVANNPGVWFFHCHIDWHLMSGLASVIVEAPDVLRLRYGATQSLELC